MKQRLFAIAFLGWLTMFFNLVLSNTLLAQRTFVVDSDKDTEGDRSTHTLRWAIKQLNGEPVSSKVNIVFKEDISTIQLQTPLPKIIRGNFIIDGKLPNQGKNVTISTLNSVQSNFSIFTTALPPQSNELRFYNLNFQGSNNALQVSNATEVLLDHVKITNDRGVAITIKSCAGVEIQNTIVQNAQNGIVLIESHGYIYSSQISNTQIGLWMKVGKATTFTIGNVENTQSNAIFGNTIGILIDSIKSYATSSSNIVIANNSIGFANANIPIFTNRNTREANGTGIKIIGEESSFKTKITQNKFQYSLQGIEIDTVFNNLIQRNVFFKTSSAARNQDSLPLPIQLNLKRLKPGNQAKAAPIITRSLIYSNNLTLQGTSQVSDQIEIYRSDKSGNIVTLLGTTTTLANGKWTFSYIPNSPLDVCSSHYFAASATDAPSQNPQNTSQFAYTNPVLANRVVEPSLSFQECNGLEVRFQDRSRNAQNTDRYELLIDSRVVSNGNHPFNATLDLARMNIAYGDHDLRYRIIPSATCAFTYQTTLHLSPDFNPLIEVAYDPASRSIKAQYVSTIASELRNITPGFEYQWKYSIESSGRPNEIGVSTIGSVNNTSEIKSYKIENIGTGKYTVKLILGMKIGDRLHPCKDSTSQTPSIPLEASVAAKPADCGDNGQVAFSVTTGVFPFDFVLNGKKQSSGLFTSLSPGTYIWEVIDAKRRRVTGTVQIQDARPEIILQSGNAPCTLVPQSTTRIEFKAYKASPNASSYQFELFNLLTNKILASGQGNYEEAVELNVPGVIAGDRIFLQLKDLASPDCYVRSESIQVAAPVLGFELDQASGIYQTCTQQSATISIRAKADLSPLTPQSANRRFQYQLQKRSENRQYQNSGNSVNTNQLSYTYNKIPEGEYRILITYDPGGFKCQSELYFQVLPPSNLAANPPEISAISCFGLNDGSATVNVLRSNGTVEYTWYAIGSPTNILSYGSEIHQLGPGDYAVRIKDERTCTNQELNYSFTITEPNALGPIGIKNFENQCKLEATFQQGQGTAPYTFSWRNQRQQEVKIDRGVTASNGVVRSAPDFTGEFPGVYFVVVIDQNGCRATSDTISLKQPKIERTYELCVRWVARGVKGEERPKPAYIRPSIEEVKGKAIAAINDQISDCISAQRLSLEAYTDRCFDPTFMADTLVLSYQLGYEHHTLFYYDRAGNLVQTVPPAGIDVQPKNRETRPRHTLVSQYQYNSLGQLTAQSSPDGGRSTFIYNDRSQLRFSQNARQADTNDPEYPTFLKIRYSYNKYDQLGRIIEVGESFLNSNQSFASLNSQARDQLFPAQASSRDITHTVYNDADSSITYLGTPNQYQRYLDNRVSYAWRLNPSGEKVITYYSYDPHGNVEWLVQDLPDIGKSYIGYHYDLISGKVLQLDYNKGYVDQLFHRYQYDEDNRLTQLETSSDGYIWDRDARYQYYPHGPLRYTILGEDQLQKTDYTYTLQGWLKAINTPDISTNTLEGPEPQKAFPQDLFGMALGYYPGDFKHRGALLDSANVYSLAALTQQKPLYNGNIAAWSSKTGFNNTEDPFANQLTANLYSYDQLNRLRASQYHRLNANGYQALPDYGTDYTYDANGNFLSLERKGLQNLGLDMDNFRYNYYPGTNRLKQVQDAVVYATGKDPYDADIKPGQTPENYVYDAGGNLIQDKQEGLRYRWDAYGKLKEVIPDRVSNSAKQKPALRFVYDALGNRVLKTVNNAPFGNNLEAIKTEYYIREGEGLALAINRRNNFRINNGYLAKYFAAERTLFGSSRIGLLSVDSLLLGTQTFNGSSGNASAGLVKMRLPIYLSLGYRRQVGQKLFELTDHLQNTRGVFADIRERDSVKLLQYSNYYAFGMVMPKSWFEDKSYRFGFNGQEKDNEIKGSRNSYDFGERIYDPRVGKFFIIDPLIQKSPWYTPYQFAGNKPILLIDRMGLEEARPDEKRAAFLKLRIYHALVVRKNSRKAFELLEKASLQDKRDGKRDAFRHAYWNALNARDLGEQTSGFFPTLHELGDNPANNPNDEEYDPVAIQMDLHNNAVGRKIGAANPNATDEELAGNVMEALNEGELKIVKIEEITINGWTGRVPTNNTGRPIQNNKEKVLIDSNEKKPDSGSPKQKNGKLFRQKKSQEYSNPNPPVK